jgi:hypothetical protein
LATHTSIAECAVTHDAELAPREFPDRKVEQAELVAARPGPQPHQRVVLAQALRQQQHRAEHVLHDRGRAVVAQVADADAALAGGLEVDIVGARGGEHDELEVG